MPRSCRVCRHAQVEAIDAAIRDGASCRETARRFGLTKSSVARHAGAHARPAEAAAVPATPTSEQPSTMPKAATATRTYRCTYPSFTICEQIRFVDGLFTTSDLELQRAVERDPWYLKSVFLEENAEPGHGKR